MAIYHLSVEVISRAKGQRAIASAAYRSGSRLHDARIDRDQHFSNKSGIVHSEVMLPEHAPEAWRDREQLWNEVEAREIRKDAQLAREVEFAISQEMNQQQGITLARDFVVAEFVEAGMTADLILHWDISARTAWRNPTPMSYSPCAARVLARMASLGSVPSCGSGIARSLSSGGASNGPSMLTSDWLNSIDGTDRSPQP